MNIQLNTSIFSWNKEERRRLAQYNLGIFTFANSNINTYDDERILLMSKQLSGLTYRKVYQHIFSLEKAKRGI